MPPRALKQINALTELLKRLSSSIKEEWRNRADLPSSSFMQRLAQSSKHQKGLQRNIWGQNRPHRASKQSTEYIQRCVSAIKQHGRGHSADSVLMTFVYCISYRGFFLFSYKDPWAWIVKVVVSFISELQVFCPEPSFLCNSCMIGWEIWCIQVECNSFGQWCTWLV